MVTQQVTPHTGSPDVVSIAWYPPRYPRKAANLPEDKESAHARRILLTDKTPIAGLSANSFIGDRREITSLCRNANRYRFQLASILSNGHPSRYGEAAAADKQGRGRV
jgi:hypothetical protein